uniref:GRAM domain-containing protein 2A-like isoform X3 n=1 Tax=Myxine glutinosa TaxID=7769 RepID=UPI00358FA100
MKRQASIRGNRNISRASRCYRRQRWPKEGCFDDPMDEPNHQKCARSLSEDGLTTESGHRRLSEGFLGGKRNPDEEVEKNTQTIIRAKTLDPIPDHEIKRDKTRDKSLVSPNKQNIHYHKLFNEVSEEEGLVDTFTCALQKDILYQGRLFVSKNWICFHANLFGKNVRISIPVPMVKFVKKEKTAKLLPNAVQIILENMECHTFASFLSRDTALKVLRKVCKNIESEDSQSSPQISTLQVPQFAESLKPKRPTILPLNPMYPNVGLVTTDDRLRDRQESETSTSDQGCTTTHSDETWRSRRTAKFSTCRSQSRSAEDVPDAAMATSGSAQNPKSIKDENGLINIILCVYLFLIVLLLTSSCYLALRIIALEKDITFLELNPALLGLANCKASSNPEENHVCWKEEITFSIARIDKIKANLQKLLQDPTS